MPLRSLPPAAGTAPSVRGRFHRTINGRPRSTATPTANRGSRIRARLLLVRHLVTELGAKGSLSATTRLPQVSDSFRRLAAMILANGEFSSDESHLRLAGPYAKTAGAARARKPATAPIPTANTECMSVSCIRNSKACCCVAISICPKPACFTTSEPSVSRHRPLMSFLGCSSSVEFAGQIVTV